MAHLSDGDALAIAAVLVFGSLLIELAVATTVPRGLARALQPGKVYPLYGFHDTLNRMVARTSNIPRLTALWGDSSAIVHYLRVLGYRFGVVEQTGSNFGIEVKQEVPTLCEIGTGTMVSDGLSLMNAEFSDSSFRVMNTAIGAGNFLGNNVRYPAGGRTGDNCLLATKVMIPVSGPVRHDVGLLGSPCFEIPRSVLRDQQIGSRYTGAERRRRLAAKTRHNVVTMGLSQLVRFLFVWGVVVIALTGPGGTGRWGVAGTVATILLDFAFLVAFWVLVDRAVTGFRGLQPRSCSIYDVNFWRHERYWKVPSDLFVQMFNGTPFKSVVWRLLGVKVGRHVFDDGCAIVEKTLVHLGSESTLNMGGILQSHSLEDGAFKSDVIDIGAGCTVGTGAWVSYGVTMDDGSVLDADSFLMKGSVLPSGTRWRGNPAAEVAIHSVPVERHAVDGDATPSIGSPSPLPDGQQDRQSPDTGPPTMRTRGMRK